MLVWVILLGGIKYILSAAEGRLYHKGLDVEKISRTGFICYTVIYGVLLLFISLVLRSYPITDYGNVYHTAYSLAMGEEVEDWSYFSMWTNNLGPLSILTFLMKMGIFLGMKDPYYFVLGVNVLQVCAVLVSLYYLSGRLVSAGSQRKHSVQWLAVICFGLWTPVWASTKAFYSDQLSFGGSIIAVAMLLYACESKKKVKWVFIVAAGLFWGLGISAKATAAVGVLALFIIGILVRKYHSYWREGLVLLLAMVAAVGILSVHARTYPSVSDEYRLKMPTEYWIAMGLIGNGTYADNEALVEGCNYSPNVEARKLFCQEQIRENWTNLFDADHLIKKASVIFGSGEISPTTHIYPVKETFLWHWVYWEGNYYWKYSCLSTGFFYAVLFLLLIGALREVLCPASHRGENLTFLIYLTLFGLFLFLMLWEAQNKQLYNHIPWLTLGMVHGLESLGDCVIMTAKRFAGRERGDVGKSTKQ